MEARAPRRRAPAGAEPSSVIRLYVDLDRDRRREREGTVACDRQRWTSARRMLTSHLAHEHPDWSEAEIMRETARRLSHGAV